MPSFLGSITLAPLVLAFPCVLSTVQIIVLLFAKESPRFLIVKKRRFSAGEEALKFYQGERGLDKVLCDMEVEVIKADTISKGIILVFLYYFLIC